MTEKRLGFDEMPKWFKAVFVFIPVFVLFGISTRLDNDFYFLYPTGEYIVNNGFPVTDILSMHSSMGIIVQQWLTTVVFYYVYSALGKAGMIVLVYLCYLAFAAVCYKLCMLITNGNQFVSSICAFAADIVIGVVFCFTRPQIFTFIAVALEIYFLEKFVKTNSLKSLIPLPFISLWVINSHSAMWLMLFVFAAPYAAQAVLVKTKPFKNGEQFSFLKLLAAGAVCFGAGFLNPYGTKAMTYIFSSFGYSEINGYITEMQPLFSNKKMFYIILVYLVIMLVIALRLNSKNYQIRFVLLFAGTLFLGLITAKSIAYFAIAGIPAFSYLVKDFNVNFKITENESTSKDKKKRIILIFLFVCAVAALIYVAFNSGTDGSKAINTSSEAEAAKADDYEALDDIAKILEKEDKLVLYTGFDYGQYMEYKGFHPYIDGRAELFLKDNNGEYDYMKELYQLDNAELYYKDFVDRYNFNYLIVSGNETYLTSSLLHDSDYHVIYETDTIRLFAKNKPLP